MVEPFARAVTTCAGQSACSASGTWYVDLDAAKAAFPGIFIGKRLDIDLLGGEIAGGPDDVPWDASLSVLMVKK